MLAVGDSRQAVGDRLPTHGFEIAAQGLYPRRRFLEPCFQGFRTLRHAAGLHKQCRDHLAHFGRTGTKRDLPADRLQGLAVFGGAIPGFREDRINRGKLLLDLMGRVPHRSVLVAGEEPVVELHRSRLAERMAAVEQTVHSPLEILIGPGKIRVPDGEVLRIGRDLLARQHVQRRAGVLRRLFEGMGVGHGGDHIERAIDAK